ncbi:YqaJ viral recombinase family protein [Pseudomonas sp. CCI3.2]|uniref:lambda exonuclease family protein n=1 Tax=unclassified Pseudomonas TaxID=196821 RepID=UPI002B235C8B|nr:MULTISPECIES: YqaJ viral recombinase family protein [unclassified Pseudomonas]MEB0078058.1 YqaJ viral recombinase family protein [Pseudomonas sp. MH10out]MEB0103175.1 YqaJ viral recombinase family protein [Pseudomonas sp. CCI3.2]MEB0133411.1 YqaJ viral recombinase family protein [Pseudomonas sp. CCI2.4]
MEQQTEEWFKARLGNVTASRVKDVMSKGRGSAPSATRKNYMMELLCERLTGKSSGADLSRNAAVQRGNELEPFARMTHELTTSVMVVEAGLVMHPRIERFGASPDGLVGDRGVLEIKCPNTATHIATMQSGERDTQYDWQMLAQMACTERDWADFVSFDDRMPEPLQYICFRFERDERRIREMETEIKEFLEELADLEAEMHERIRSKAA